MFKQRRNQKTTKRNSQGGGFDINDWRNVVGRHSIMLALEPRFMFDGAGAEGTDPNDAAGGPDVPDINGDGHFDGDGGNGGDGHDAVTVFNTGLDARETRDIDPADAEELALAVGSSATSGVTLDEDGSTLINDIEITGGSDDDYVMVEISLGGGGTNKVDFDFDPNNFQGSGIWGEGNIDRSRQGEGIISVWGTRSDVNKLLDTLTFEGGKDVYTTGNGVPDIPETMTVSLYSCDAEGKNASLIDTTDPVDITIREVNDVTIIDVPTVGGITVNQVVGYEDVPLRVNDAVKNLVGQDASGLEVYDPDDLDGYIVIEFELGDDWGRLSFGQDGNGSWTSVANGTYTFQGTREQVQDVLDSLVYKSPADQHGNETLTISVYDDRTAVSERSAPVTIDIKITEVNDDPVFKDTLPSDFLAMDNVAEGSSQDFTADMFNLTDIDNADAHLVITLNEAPKHGTIQKKVGSNYVDILQGESFTYQDVIDGLIRYQHGGDQVRSDGGVGDDFHFTDSFTFSVNDGAGGFLNSTDPAHKGQQITDPVTGITKTTHTFDISLNPVNQAPEVSVGVDDDGNPGDVVYEIHEGQEEFAVIFDVTDGDQLAANDYQVKITDVSNLDGTLYYYPTGLSGARVEVTAGMVIDYAAILAGNLRFSHDGSDGYDGVMGKTRDTGFSFEVIDDGGGSGTPSSTHVDLVFTVLPNNDNPEFVGNLVDDGHGGVTVDGAQVGKGVGAGDADSWLIQMGPGLNQGGFDIGDVDSKGKDITYTLVETPAYGDVWIHNGGNSYTRLKAGESFTQQQIDDGKVYFHTTVRDQLVETAVKVTVRDGSLTAWAKEVDAAGNDVRDPNTGELVVHEGIEGAVGSFVDGVWTPTVVSIGVKYYVVSGGPPVEIVDAPEIYLGAGDPETKTVLEGKEVSLDGILDGYYVDKNGVKIDAGHPNHEYAADPDKLIYRIESKLTCGKLWLTDGMGNKIREIGQYGSFSQADLANLVYEHDGSENFTDSFRVTLTDGSINLLESQNSPVIKQLTVTIDVTPGNDSPEVATGELLVTEGAEAHQDGETGFDRNGSVITPGNIGITDPDGNGDTSKAGSDYKSSDADLTFVVQKPGYGDIWVWTGTGSPVPSNADIDANPEKSLDQYPGWHKLTAAEYAASDYSNVDTAYSFTNEQLKNGCIRYVHDGRDPSLSSDALEYYNPDTGKYYDPAYEGSTDPTFDKNPADTTGNEYYRAGSFADELHFRVYDGKGFEEGDAGYHHQSWTDGTLAIKVSNVNDKPRDILGDDAKEFHSPESGNRDPNYTSRDDVSLPTTGTLITNEYLNYVDAEKNPASLQYYIDKAPTNGTLYLNVGGVWTAIGAGAKFTQDDINCSRVKYVHNGTETHADSFAWTLRDGDENQAKWVANKTFDIVVDPTNNPPEIAVKPNEAKSDPSDRYVYVTPPDVTGGKDLGGVFQVKDRDYQGDGQGMVKDELEATLSSTIAQMVNGHYTQGSVASGDLFIDLTGLSPAQIARLGDVEISTDGGLTYTRIADLIGGEAGGSAEIMLKGALDEVNAALDLLHYRPDTDSSSPGFCDDRTANIRLEVNDLGNGDVDGDNALQAYAEIAEMQMYLNVDNDPPTLPGGLPDPGELTMNEDSGAIDVKHNGNWLHFDDSDPMDGWARNELTLSVKNGVLDFGSSNAKISSKVVNGERVYTVKGSLDDINNALDGLTYKPNLDYNGTETVAVKFQDHISDDGVVEGAFAIAVIAMNDTPVLTGTDDTLVVKGYEDTTVGGSLAIDINDAKDTDPSKPAFGNPANAANLDKNMTVTLTVERTDLVGDNGKLTLAGNADVTVTVNADNEIVLTGKEDAINALLADLQFKASSNDGVYNLHVKVDDNMNGGDAGDSGVVEKDFTLVIATGSTIPTVDLANGGDIAITEDTPTTTDGSGTDLGIRVASRYPVSAGLEDQMRVELSLAEYGKTTAGKGTLSLDASGTGATVTVAPNGKSVVVTGTEAQVNAALAKLVYKPATHNNRTTDPVDTVTITVVDKPGFSGSTEHMVNTGTTVDIRVAAVNDAPTVVDPSTPADMNAGGHVLPEDISPADNAGRTVADLFTPKFSDSKDAVTGGSSADSLAGVIVTANNATVTQGQWQYQDPATGNWVTIPSGSGQSIYLGAKVAVRFQPAANYNGIPGQLTVRLVDDSAYESHNGQHDAVPGAQTDGSHLPGIHQDDLGYYINTAYAYTVPSGAAGTGNNNTSRYSDATVRLRVTVKAVNDAPVVNSSSPVAITVDEDRPGSAHTVGGASGLFTNYFSDPNDTGRTAGADSMAGVVITSVNDQKGTWQYWNASTLSWDSIAAVLASGGSDKGLFLNTTGQIRFVPNEADFNGDPSSDITVRLVETDPNADSPDANVYTSGALVGVATVGGSTRISDGTIVAQVTVNPVNDAPVASNPTVPVELPALTEDISDGKSGGVYINPGHSVNDLFNKNDGSQNDRFSDPSDQVTGGSSSDDFAGIVVVGNTADPATQGQWQYLDESGNWQSIGTRAEGSGNLLYLNKDAVIRFQPAANFNGTPPELLVRLADDSAFATNNLDNPALPVLSGGKTYAEIDGTTFASGGTTRYSADTVRVTVAVNAVNDAPVVSGTANQVTMAEDDANNAGVTVDSVFSGAFSDPNDATVTGGRESASDQFAGVIIKTVDNGTHGVWQYESSPGVWTTITTQTTGEGLFLQAGTKIRFSPNAGDNFNGDPAASIEAHLVETASDNTPFAANGSVVTIGMNDVGGTTRVSAGTVVSAAVITPVNDAPVVNGSSPAVITVDEDRTGSAHTVGGAGGLFTNYFSDPNDTGRTAGADAMAGVVITSVNDQKGTWQYWNASTSSWDSIAAVLASGGSDKGLFLNTTGQIRFVPNEADFNGDPSSDITVRLVETDANADSPDTNVYTSGALVGVATVGGTTRISDGTIMARVTVNPVNDAPIASNPTVPVVLPPVAEDISAGKSGGVYVNPGHTVNDLFNKNDGSQNDRFSDPNDQVTGGSSSDDFAGIVVVGNTANPTTQGEWQYLDESGNWQSIGTRAEGSGNLLYLSKDAVVRFQPAADFNGTPPELLVRLADDSAFATNNPDNPALPVLSGGKTYAEIDGTTFASGGTTRYSADTVRVTVAVDAVNDAPVVSGSANQVTVAEDDANNAGVTVDSVFGGAFGDPNDATVTGGRESASDSFAGVIIKTVDNGTHGVWQYESSPGVWTTITPPATGEGLFLAAGTTIRFSPNAGDNFNGDPAASIEVHLVETASDNTPFAANGSVVTIGTNDVGGTTRVSAGTVTTDAVVTPVNDAPIRTGGETIDGGQKDMSQPSPDGYYQNSVDAVFGGKFDDARDQQHSGGNTDGSRANSFDGVIVTGVNPASEGVWQYEVSPGTWADIVVGPDQSLYLQKDTQIRFVPNTDTFDYHNGTLTGSLTVRLVETVVDGGGDPAGSHAYSHLERITDAVLNDTSGTAPHSDAANKVVLEIPVIKTNNAPSLSGISDLSVDEQTPVRLAENGVVSDADLDRIGANGNWAGASLVVERVDGNPPAPGLHDTFGTVAGGDVILGADGTVYLRNQAVGSYADTGGKLSVVFNDKATRDAVKEVLGSLTYTYDNDCPPDNDVVLRYTLADGNGGTQGRGLDLNVSVDQRITVNPVADRATPTDDANHIDVDYATPPECSGNVLENDTHPDHQRTFSPTADLVVAKVDGVDIAGGGAETVIPGRYGELHIKSDGTYTYVVDRSNSEVAEMEKTGETLTETFTYEAKDASYAGTNLNGSADLVITLSPTGRVPLDPPHVDTPRPPVYVAPSVPEGPAIGDVDVDKPVVSTVGSATRDSTTRLNESLDRLGVTINDSVLPPRLEAIDALRHGSWMLDEARLVGNTDQRSARIGEAQEFTLPDDLFVHSRPKERLAYTATLADGSALPEWLVFDPETFCISCTPPVGSEGSVEMIINAEDRRGLRADATVTIKIGDAEQETSDEGAAAEQTDGNEQPSGNAQANRDQEGIEESGSDETDPVDDSLSFAGEWVLLDVSSSADEPAPEGAHPGLRSQIDATGSTALLAEARRLVEVLAGGR